MSLINYDKMRVLLVEDQRPFLVLLRGILNGLGCKSVVTTQNAESAVSACKKEKFDLIIADVHLGNDRKNGYQFLEEVRVLKLAKPETVFIMVSGDSQRPVVLGSLERQPDDYLIKPFSQQQLSNRLVKAYQKKQALKSIYLKVHKDDYEGALQACRELIAGGCKYRQACCYLMTELYWKLGQFKQAHHMLKPIVQHKPVPWAVVALAKTEMHMENYGVSIDLAQQVVKNRILAVEGHDILAQCYWKRGDLDEAIRQIKKSIVLSPFSLDRQYLGVNIARENNDFEFARSCCKAIFEQSKRSVYRDVSHLCNFVRSILDAAENADEKGDRNKFQQEALLTLERLKNDDIISRLNEPFNYNAFEDIINARVNFLDGKLMEAKRSLARSQELLHKRFDEFPLALAPDSIKVMFDLGEFEDAAYLSEKLKSSDYKIDSNIDYLLSKTVDQAEEKAELFNKYKQEGLECYNEGKFQAAHDAFKQALQLSPVNTPVALSLLQSLLQMLGRLEKPEYNLVLESKKIYKMINGQTLSPQLEEKFGELRKELTKYTDL